MSVNWCRKSFKDAIPIPPTVQEQPEDEAQAAAAGQNYQYPDIMPGEEIRNEVAYLDGSEGVQQKYNRPRSAPSSDQSVWFPREGYGRPFSAGGGARRVRAAMTKSDVFAPDDHDSVVNSTNPPLEDYYLHYPQKNLYHDLENGKSSYYDNFARCEQDVQVEDYLTDSSSASEEDEILYDARVEDPDRVKFLTSFEDNVEEVNNQTELDNKDDKRQQNATSQKTNQKQCGGRKVTARVIVKCIPKRRLTADLNSMNGNNQEMLYTKGTGITPSNSREYPSRIKEETTSDSSLQPVRSIYTSPNNTDILLNISTKPFSSQQCTAKTTGLSSEMQHNTKADESLTVNKQLIQYKGAVATADLTRPFLNRAKLCPPNLTQEAETEQDIENKKNTSRETAYSVKSTAYPIDKHCKTSTDISKGHRAPSMPDDRSNSLGRRQIKIASIAYNTEVLRQNQGGDGETMSFLGTKDNYKSDCSPLSVTLAQSLQVGKKTLRVVPSQSEKIRHIDLREKEKQQLTSTLELLKNTQNEVEEQKKHKQELEDRMKILESQLNDANTKLDRASGISKRLREENREKSDKLEQLQGNLTFTEEKLKSLESRALEIERMELTIEQLKKAIESNNLTIREKNSEIRLLKLEAEEAGRNITHLEKSNKDFTAKVNDLKSQVKEELTRNSVIDKKLEEMSQLRQELNSKNNNIADLQTQLEEKNLILSNARKILKQEREKLKHVQTSNSERDQLRDELHIVRCENITLKKLLVGKDVLVIRKTQALDLAKGALKEMQLSKEQSEEIMRQLENPATLPTYPQGTNHADSDSQFVSSYEDNYQERSKSAPQLQENPRQNAMTRRQNNNTSQTGLGFRTPKYVENNVPSQAKTEPSDKQLNENNEETNKTSKFCASSFLGKSLDAEQQKPIDSQSPESPNDVQSQYGTGLSVINDRQLKTAIVRPQIYQRTFANFRSPSNSDGSYITESTLKSQINRSDQQEFNMNTLARKDKQEYVPVCKNPKAVVRRRSLQTKSTTSIKSGESANPQPRSPMDRSTPKNIRLKCSTSSANSMALIPYNDKAECSKLEKKRVSSAPVPRVLTAMEKDQLAAQFINVGHRALVDIGKKRGSKQILESAVVKYVGHVDNTYDDCRIYVGVKLDEPIGDTDGIFKGKRYFCCNPQHGKFVKISRVNSILDTKASRFKPIKEGMQRCLAYMNRSRLTSAVSECGQTDDTTSSKSTAITTLSLT